MTSFRQPFSFLAAAVALTLASRPVLAEAVSSATLPQRPAGLQGELDALAQRARPGTLGVTVVELRSGSRWRVNAGRAYPMMSVFKAPVASAVLARIDGGSLSMEQAITLTRADLHPGSAVPSIGTNFQGERMTFTVRRLLAAAVSQSDNTAVDALIKLVGGPAAVTKFLRTHGVVGMRVDEDEAGVARVFDNLGGRVKPPAGETPGQEDQRLRGGYRAFLADPRNRSTPEAAATFLQKLCRREVLSCASTRYLLGLMHAQTVPHRLRDGLPPYVRLADKCGTSGSVDGRTAAYNDIGILTWPDGHTVIVAAFLTASEAPKADRDAIFADLARETVKALHPNPGPRFPPTHQPR